MRVVVMNNVLPRAMKMHFKYDLKGSSYKRRASRKERVKDSPTFKDLDFQEMHQDGLYFDSDTYNALMRTLQRDCRVRLHQQLLLLFHSGRCTVLSELLLIRFSFVKQVRNLENSLRVDLEIQILFIDLVCLNMYSIKLDFFIPFKHKITKTYKKTN